MKSEEEIQKIIGHGFALSKQYNKEFGTKRRESTFNSIITTALDNYPANS